MAHPGADTATYPGRAALGRAGPCRKSLALGSAPVLKCGGSAGRQEELTLAAILGWSLSLGLALGKAFDDLDDLVAPEPVAPREFEEIPCPGEDGTALGCAGHGDATPAPELQQAFFPEHVQRTQNGVLIDAQHGRDVFGQGQA